MTLPAEPGEKIGLDDFLAGGGTVEQLEALRSPKVPGDPEPKRRETRGGELVKMAESMEVELWHDEQGEPFATIPKNGHFETVRCESREMRGFLYSAWKGKTGTGASSDSLKEAADGLANQARFNGREYPTATRVGRAQGATYLFLADEEHRAVEITAAGWKVVPGHECSVKFVKSKTALPLPVPVQLGDLELLRRFLSVDAKGFELVKAFLLACLMPKGTFPVLVVGGEQGSGKSSGCRYIRWVLDPCEPMLGAWTADLRDMASAVKNNYILAFDNISSVPEKVADALCRILTGGGFANRELYTNAEEYVVRAWNPVLLNGIGSYATRGDLLDRALFVPFQPIEGTKGFKTEQSLEREFKETLPYILGGLLDLASTAMAKLAEVQGQGYENSRLSDLGLWIAASEPLATRGAFAKLLAEAKSETNRALLELDPAGSAILEFVQERQREWTGPLGELLKELKSHQAFNKDNPPPEGWPKGPKALQSQLDRIIPNLRACGVEVKRLKRTGTVRPCRVSPLKVPGEPSQPSRTPEVEPENPLAGDDGLMTVEEEPSSQPSQEEGGVLSLDDAPNDGCDANDGLPGTLGGRGAPVVVEDESEL